MLIRLLQGAIFLPLLGAVVAQAQQAPIGDRIAHTDPARYRHMPTEPTLTVTADNANLPFGMANPDFAYTISGFLNGDTQASATTGTPILPTNATIISSPRTYPMQDRARTHAHR
jgi:hypothetical protein